MEQLDDQEFDDLDLEALYGPTTDELSARMRHASPELVAALVDELADRWVCPNVQASALYAHLHRSLFSGTVGDSGDAAPDGTIHIPWNAIRTRLRQHSICLLRLRKLVHVRGEVSGGLIAKLDSASKCIHILPQFVKHAHLALNVCNGSSFVLGAPLPPSAQRDYDDGGDGLPVNYPPPSVGDDNANRNTNFQRCFLHLCEVLLGCGYRRAEGELFERARTATGFDTLAYVKDISIKDFVSDHVSHIQNFEAWQWATNPPSNITHLIKYMEEHSVPEAPRLKENCYLRSYEGDAVGRGAGVYDCREDLFYPYALRGEWAAMAAEASEVRKRLRQDPSYEASAPSEQDVAVIHLKGAFPHDTLQEIAEAARADPGTMWREADAWECARPELRVDAPRLAELLAQRLPAGAPSESASWGRSWIPAAGDAAAMDKALAGFREVLSEDLTEALEAGKYSNVDPGLCTGVGERTFVRLATGAVYVPLCTPPRRPRVRITPEERDAACDFADDDRCQAFFAQAGAYVQAADGRCFRPHTGRTWRDVETPELDNLFECQHMSDHDCFFLYAYQGRLFYAVGEFDNHQNTLMIEGIGGSGKSTLMLVSQAFWPKHLQGIMSSNMQPQFGMSAVLKDNTSRVIYCNEVSADLSVVQEEWQTTVSGETGSYAVKNQQHPLVCRAKAQHFWCGNGFPGGDGGGQSRAQFKNNQLQVSRRLAGVLFAYPVAPRNGNILTTIQDERMGALQRRMVLAYFEFVRVTGHVDPMSTAEYEQPLLPPAFLEYYWRGARASNPVESFLSDPEYVEKSVGAMMTFQRFRELYGEYRLREGLSREGRLGEDQWRTPFVNRGLVKMYKSRWFDPVEKIEHTRVQLILNLRPVRGRDDDPGNA